MTDVIRARAKFGEARDHFHSHLMTVTDLCKLWPFQTDKDGYGVLRTASGHDRVHVLACAAWNGPMPDPGLVAAHGPCHNPSCWNGSHLSWKTVAQNAADMRRDGTEQVGSQNPFSKLNEDQVREIRKLHASGVRRGLIAREFGVHHNTVDLIVRRIRWTHIE